MSWNTGLELFAELVAVIEDKVPDFKDRVEIYTDMLDIFESYDCDISEELEGESDACDEALEEYLSSRHLVDSDE